VLYAMVGFEAPFLVLSSLHYAMRSGVPPSPEPARFENRSPAEVEVVSPLSRSSF